MELTGKLEKKFSIVTGVSKAGKPWQKIEFLINDGRKKRVFSSLNSDVIQMVSDTDEGTNVRVDYDWESREYNGKWYTNASAFIVEKVASASRPRRKDAEQMELNPIVIDPGDIVKDIEKTMDKKWFEDPESGGSDDLPF